MGRIFLDHIGGTRLFSCANCDTILTNRSELISTRFTGATGRAFLFNKVGKKKKKSFILTYLQWMYLTATLDYSLKGLQIPGNIRMVAETYGSGCLLACLWDFRVTLLVHEFIYVFIFIKPK